VDVRVISSIHDHIFFASADTSGDVDNDGNGFGLVHDSRCFVRHLDRPLK
jgi:hypothetical protein